MTFAFAGQIFQFVARACNVDNYGFDFTLRHPLNLWKAQNDAVENLDPGPKCIGPKLFRVLVFPGQSKHQAEMCLGSQYPWGQSEFGAKEVLGPNWV